MYIADFSSKSTNPNYYSLFKINKEISFKIMAQRARYIDSLLDSAGYVIKEYYNNLSEELTCILSFR